MNAPSLFDAAREARDAAIAQVDEHADDDWKECAWAFLIDYLHRHDELFVDDLWAAGLPPTREDRALGPLVLRASRAGYIVKTGRFRQRTRGHLSPGIVWRSLLHQGSAS